MPILPPPRLITGGTGPVPAAGTLLGALAASLSNLPSPGAQLFADVDGTPTAPPAGSTGAEAAAMQQAAAAHLGALAALLQRLDPTALTGLVAPPNPDEPHFASASSESGGVRIEELPVGGEEHAVHASLAARLVLAAAQWCPCPPLPTPWVAEATAAAAQQVLQTLAAAATEAAAAGGLCEGVVAEQGTPALQPLVLTVLSPALQQLRPSLMCSKESEGSGLDSAAGKSAGG